jgi:hypothetical protein
MVAGKGGQGGAFPILTPDQRKKAEKKVGSALLLGTRLAAAEVACLCREPGVGVVGGVYCGTPLRLQDVERC